MPIAVVRSIGSWLGNNDVSIGSTCLELRVDNAGQVVC